MSNFNFCQAVFREDFFIVKNGKIVNVINFSPNNNKEFKKFLKNKSGIYFWINLLDNKIYIGSSVCLLKRFYSYWNSFHGSIRKNNKKLFNSINKHGLNNFKFGIIQILNNDKKLLKQQEQDLLDEIQPFDKNGYNISKSAWRPLNCKISKRGRSIISKRHTGENSEMAKLSDEKVKKIKIRLSMGEKLKTLSNDFSVSTTVISNIKRGLTWTHIKMDNEIEIKLNELSDRDKRKFPKELVLKIKNDFKNGLKTFEIAKKYDLIYSSVHSIKNKHIYSDIE